MTTKSITHPAVGPWHRLRAWLLPVGIVVCVTMVRMVYVSLYGAAIPFWDQWDELNELIVPWVQGTWHAGQLLSPHNEHRIAFTRLISLVLFKANGGIWDNLVEAYANTVIYAGMLALLYSLLCRGEIRPGIRRVMFVAVVAIGSLPFDWENTLVGFQNQFYLMEIFAIALVGIASYRRCNRSTFWLLLLLGMASLFTMAAGLLAAAAVCVVIVLRSWCEPVRPSFFLAVVTGMLLAIVIGLVLIPDGLGSEINAAQGMHEHVRALVTALMWPLQSFSLKYSPFALFVWFPTLIWLLRFLRLRQAKSHEIFAVGIAAWVVLQAVAIAHARGHGMTSLPSRYMEIMAIGLLANLWLALHMVGPPFASKVRRLAGIASISLGLALAVAAFVARSQDDYLAMQQRHAFSQLETHQTRFYLATGDFTFLQQPALIIPYPDAGTLQGFLDSPIIRMALPSSISAPLHPIIQEGGNAKDSSRVSEAPSDGWLSTAAGVLRNSTRKLAGRFGVVVPDALYTEPRAVSNLSSDATPPSIGICSLDEIDLAPAQPVTTTVSSGPLQISGWTIDSHNAAPKTFALTLIGPRVYQLEGHTGIARPDVATAYHSQAAGRSGFLVAGTLERAVAGTYEIKLIMKGEHGPDSICNTGHKVVVKH